MHRVRRTVVSSVISIGTVAGLMSLGALPASAHVEQASQALHVTSGGPPNCSGDVCAKWVKKISPNVKIETWAFKTNFDGHFELTVPSGTHFNSSPNREWRAGKAGAHFTVGLSSGNYRATAWELLSSGKYKDLGTVIFTV